MNTLPSINSLLVLIQGFILCASLIVTVGPQNIFILQQGLRRQHLFTTAFFCTLPDFLLISFGVGGLGALISVNQVLLMAATLGGAIFLLGYALLSFRSAWRGRNAATTQLANVGGGSIKKTILTTLAVSLLNPVAYLDTILMIGTTSGQYPLDERMIFGTGAAIASTLWFFTLAYGASRLTPIFSRPLAWRTLDIVSGCFMLGTAGLMCATTGIIF